MDVEERAAAAGYRLAQRSLKGKLVWWWQLLDPVPDGVLLPGHGSDLLCAVVGGADLCLTIAARWLAAG